MPEADAVDVILRLQNLRRFVAGSREAAASVRSIGKASEESSAMSRASAVGGTRQVGVLGLLRKASLGAAGGLAIMGVEGVKLATNFDAAMTQIHTQAGASTLEVSKMRGEVLKLATVMPQSPQQLAEGLYHIESIGLRGAKALDALKVAANGAMVGNSNLEATSTALGSAWLANIKGAGTLHHTMALLNATVGAGNMRMDDLVHALGTGILPSAKVAGLGIKDVMGALAILSDEGYQGSSAMAQLGTALHFLYNPTNKAEKALEGLHLSGVKLSNTMSRRGLPAALQLLHDRLQKFGGTSAQQKQVLGDILPGGRGRVLLVLMNQLDRYNMKIRQITHTTGNFAEATRKAHETTANKLREAWSSVQVDLIKVGHALEPIAVAGARVFATLIHAIVGIPGAVKSVINWFGHLPGPIKIAAAAVGIMVGQGVALYAAIRTWALLTTIFGNFKTGLLAVRGAFILLQTGSGPMVLTFMALSTAAVLIITHWHEMSPLARSLAVGLTAIATALALAKWGGTIAGITRTKAALRGLAAFRWAEQMAIQLRSGFAAQRLIDLVKSGLARFRGWFVATETATGAAGGAAGGVAAGEAELTNQRRIMSGGRWGMFGRTLGMTFGIAFGIEAANWANNKFKSLFHVNLPHIGFDPHLPGTNIPQPGLPHFLGGGSTSTPSPPTITPHIPHVRGFGGVGGGVQPGRGTHKIAVAPLASIPGVTPANPLPDVTSVNPDLAPALQHTTIVQVDSREIGRAVSTFVDDQNARA